MGRRSSVTENDIFLSAQETWKWEAETCSLSQRWYIPHLHEAFLFGGCLRAFDRSDWHSDRLCDLYMTRKTLCQPAACQVVGYLLDWLFFHLYRLLLYLCVKQTMKTSASPAVTALLAVSVSPCWRNILQKTVKVSISLTFFIHCMASNISEHHVGLIQKTAFTIPPFDQSPKLVQPANILRTTSTLIRCCSWLCIPTLVTVLVLGPLFGIHSKNISFILLWIYHNEL